MGVGCCSIYTRVSGTHSTIVGHNFGKFTALASRYAESMLRNEIVHLGAGMKVHARSTTMIPQLEAHNTTFYLD